MTAADVALLLEARARTDYEIPIKWVWAPVSSYIIWATIAILIYLSRGRSTIQLTIPLGILGLAGFAFSALSSYLVYQLVNRRNSHFAREEALLWKTLDAAKSKAPQNDMKTLLPISSAEQDLTRLSEMGKERSAILWALLTLIPYAGWVAMTYVLAFLTYDIVKHERTEDAIIEDLGRVVKLQAGPDLPTRRRRVPNRSLPLYIVLSVATLGIFLLFWIYQEVRDPDAHLEHHRSFEETLAMSGSGLGTSGDLRGAF